MNWSALFTTIIGAGIQYGPAVITFVEKEGPVVKSLFSAAQDLIAQLKANGTPDGTAVAKGATVAGGALLSHIATTQFAPDVKSFIDALPIPIPALSALFGASAPVPVPVPGSPAPAPTPGTLP